MLMIPALLHHEHYERVLQLLDKPLPVMFDALETELKRAIAAARVEALYSIGGEKLMDEAKVLLENSPQNRFSKAVLLKVE